MNELKMFLSCLYFVFRTGMLDCIGGMQQLFSPREQDGGGD